jgi:hypothetical protein
MVGCPSSSKSPSICGSAQTWRAPNQTAQRIENNREAEAEKRSDAIDFEFKFKTSVSAGYESADSSADFLKTAIKISNIRKRFSYPSPPTGCVDRRRVLEKAAADLRGNPR